MHRTLHAIAGMKLRSGDTLSETAVALRLIDGPDPLVMRQAVRDAFLLLIDRGIASPPFGPGDVVELACWNGRDE